MSEENNSKKFNQKKNNLENLGTDKVRFKTQKKLIEKGSKIKLHSSKSFSSFSIFIFKNFKLIILIEVILILLLGYFFIIQKQLSGINRYQELILEKENELNLALKYKKTSSKFEEEYESIQKQVEEDIDKLYEILPPREDLPNIMAQIEALVNKHGFNLGSISMSSERESLGKEKMPVPIKLNNKDSVKLIRDVDIEIFVFTEDGDYSRVMELLDAFENHIRFIDITSFGFENDMGAYSIILKTYYLNYESR